MRVSQNMRWLSAAFALVSLTVAGRAFASPFSVDISKREAARVFYNTVYKASDGVAIEWTGDIARCEPGTVSPAYLTAVLERINYYRALAGLPSDITFTDEYNRLAQVGAVAMSANKDISHAPPTTWKCYSDDVLTAAKSCNLAGGNVGPAAIDSLVWDGDEVGHRRWILYPQQLTMGSGNIPSTAAGGYAVGTNYVFGGRRPERPPVRDQFVAWPPKGFVPYQVLADRWSLSLDGADFAQAAVSMTRDGADLPVEIVTRAAAGGFGEAAVVWRVPALGGTNARTRPAADQVFKVRVSGVTIDGAAQTFEYDVTSFDPAAPGADYMPPVVSGPDQVMVSQATRFEISAVPEATGYQWRSRPLSALPASDGADNGVASFDTKLSDGYDVIDRQLAGAGQSTFHLGVVDFQTQILTYKQKLLPDPNARLTFKSRGVSMSHIVARVEVSTDDGKTWTKLFEQVGVSEENFNEQVIELAPYVGKTIQVRFSSGYDFSGGSIGFSAESGWYLDDIAFSNVLGVGGFDVSAVMPGTSFEFTAGAAGTYELAAQPQYGGQYLTEEFGPGKRVTVPSP